MRLAISGLNINLISGGNLYPRRLGVGITRVGHEIKVVSASLPKNLLPKEDPKNYLRLHFLGFFSVLRELYKFSPDAVILNSFSFSDFLLLLLAKSKKLPAFYIVHTKLRDYLQNKIKIPLIIHVIEYGYFFSQKNDFSLRFESRHEQVCEKLREN